MYNSLESKFSSDIIKPAAAISCMHEISPIQSIQFSIESYDRVTEINLLSSNYFHIISPIPTSHFTYLPRPETMTDDFSTDMSDKIREIDNLRAAQRVVAPEEHALSETWHDPLLWALMLEIVRKILLLGSEGLQNEFHFAPKDGT
jgi:hypothetical protein